MKKKKILIVEDNPDLSKETKEMIAYKNALEFLGGRLH